METAAAVAEVMRLCSLSSVAVVVLLLMRTAVPPLSMLAPAGALHAAREQADANTGHHAALDQRTVALDDLAGIARDIDACSAAGGAMVDDIAAQAIVLDTAAILQFDDGAACAVDLGAVGIAQAAVASAQAHGCGAATDTRTATVEDMGGDKVGALDAVAAGIAADLRAIAVVDGAGDLQGRRAAREGNAIAGAAAARVTAPIMEAVSPLLLTLISLVVLLPARPTPARVHGSAHGSRRCPVHRCRPRRRSWSRSGCC